MPGLLPDVDAALDPVAGGPDDTGPRPARRSLVAAVALGAGFTAARAMPTTPGTLWFTLACAALIIAATMGATAAAPRAARIRLLCCVALTIAAAAFGAGWFAIRIHEAPIGGLGALLGAAAADNRAGDETDDPPRPMLTIDGIVVERPQPIEPAGGALGRYAAASAPRLDRTTLAIRAAVGDDGPVPAEGLLTVTHPPASPPLLPGERIRITGRFSPPAPPLNPGETDRRLRAAQSDLCGTLAVPSAELIQRLPSSTAVADRLTVAWAAAIDALRARAAAALDAALPEADPGDRDGDRAAASRAVLRQLLLGERDASAGPITTAFTRQGLVHVLAISGFHLVVMTGVVLFLIRLTGDRGRLEPILAAALVTLYMLIVPANAPVIRSGLMVLALLATEACGRRYDRLTVLGWVAVALLLWQPLDLWSLGWQLSFGIVAVLLWTGRAFHDRVFPPPLRGTVRTPLRAGVAGRARAGARFVRGCLEELVSTSILCWLVAAPVVAYHTGIVSPLAPLTSVVVVPIVTLALWLGYTALLLGALVPAAAAAVGWALAAIADATAAIVLWFDSWPFLTWRLPAVSLAWTVIAVAALLVWARGMGFSKGRWTPRGWRALPVVAAIGAWLAVEVVGGPWLSSRGWRGEGVLRVDAIAVGDGSCVLIRSGPDAVLWDCGSDRTGLGEREVPRTVRALGAWRVATLVLTDASEERLAGAIDIVEPLGIRRALVGPAVLLAAERMPGSVADAAVRGLRERGVDVRAVHAGEAIRIGDATLECVWPPGSTGDPSAAPSLAGESAVVGRVAAPTAGGERSVLIVGDTPAGRRALFALGAGARSDGLIVAGAAARGGPLVELCGVVQPTVAVRSSRQSAAGRSDQTESLRHADRTWYTTGTDGAAWIAVGRDGAVRHGSVRTGSPPR